MKRAIFFLFVLLTVCAHASQKSSLDSLYARLDKELSLVPQYNKAKEQRINQLRMQLEASKQPRVRYELLCALYREYQTYENDQAIDYLKDALDVAEAQGWGAQRAQSNLDLVNQYMCAGYYSEARDYLDKVSPRYLDRESLIKYYSCHSHLYQYMANNTREDKLKASYREVAAIYRDSLFRNIDTQSTDYLWESSMKLANEEKFDSLMQVSDLWMKRVEPGTHAYAVMAYFRSEAFRGTGHDEERKQWLMRSAISDIQTSTRDQTSLWSLADILSQEGDVERAHRFVEYSWQCAQKFNTRLLNWLVSPVLSSVNDTYNERLRAANRRFVWLTAAMGLLAAGLIATIVVMRRRKRQLDVARQKLDTTNAQLTELNQQLSLSNAKLGEASRMKDEYIGLFFSICSQYIDKMDNYRIKVNRKLKAGQTNELLRMTASEQMRDDELEELLSHFDEMFLELFPHFVGKFNDLLTPEGRITLDDPQHLTTQLRIFALIRLGIEESSKIAEFLHYSPNSIYNYRARMRSKAAGDRNDFERQVKAIM